MRFELKWKNDMVFTKWTWSRKEKRKSKNYEFSSKGDKRFSPLYAKLPNGQTVEDWYHRDLKGYGDSIGHWIEVKGKPPIVPMTEEYQYQAFKNKLIEFLFNDRPLLAEFIQIAKTHDNFVDRFATTKINQARAYADIAYDLFIGRLKVPPVKVVKEYEDTDIISPCSLCGELTSIIHVKSGTALCAECAQ